MMEKVMGEKTHLSLTALRGRALGGPLGPALSGLGCRSADGR